MRATGVAKKDGSITVITFGHGGGDLPYQARASDGYGYRESCVSLEIAGAEWSDPADLRRARDHRRER